MLSEKYRLLYLLCIKLLQILRYLKSVNTIKSGEEALKYIVFSSSVCRKALFFRVLKISDI